MYMNVNRMQADLVDAVKSRAVRTLRGSASPVDVRRQHPAAVAHPRARRRNCFRFRSTRNFRRRRRPRCRVGEPTPSRRSKLLGPTRRRRGCGKRRPVRPRTAGHRRTTSAGWRTGDGTAADRGNHGDRIQACYPIPS